MHTKPALSPQTSQSQIISQTVAEVKEWAAEQLAAEGYQFYAQESLDFAATSAPVVAQAICERLAANRMVEVDAALKFNLGIK